VAVRVRSFPFLLLTTAKQALTAFEVAIRRAQTILGEIGVDGDFGTLSRAREKALRKLAKSSPGAEWPPWVSEPSAWPRWDSRAECDAFFLPLRLVKITPPYPLRIFYDGKWRPMKTLTCHAKVADSLSRCLAAILAHYGTLENIKGAGMDVCEGVYVDRPVTGGKRPSMHAYGAAIDFNAELNPLGGTGKMPAAVVSIFKREGWRWGGDYKKRLDPMHFEACR